MSKKIVLVISGLISLSILVSNYIGTYKLCEMGNKILPLDKISKMITYGCTDFLYDIIIILSIFIPILILSLITYKMRDEVFGLWSKFTYVWLPLTLILVSIAPEYMNSWLPIYEKGFVSFVMSAIYLLASCVIIVVKYVSLKKRVL